jgi:hypothetical protein
MTIKQHDCDSLPKSGVYIYLEDDDPTWTLNIQKEATESDLEENCYLENIGDTIWVTRIGILYCPFCGEKLPELESVDLDSYGHFQHNDYSRWW